MSVGKDQIPELVGVASFVSLTLFEEIVVEFAVRFRADEDAMIVEKDQVLELVGVATEDRAVISGLPSALSISAAVALKPSCVTISRKAQAGTAVPAGIALWYLQLQV